MGNVWLLLKAEHIARLLDEWTLGAETLDSKSGWDSHADAGENAMVTVSARQGCDSTLVHKARHTFYFTGDRTVCVSGPVKVQKRNEENYQYIYKVVAIISLFF